MKNIESKVYGGIMGLCIADAIGVPFEFVPRNILMQNPVKDMQGYGTFNLLAGTWSDDSSMTLCLADSLADGLNYDDIMQRFYSWIMESKYTPYEKTFDVGSTTIEAILKFKNGCLALSCGGHNEQDNGNGSLMRILPIAYYVYIHYGSYPAKNEDAMKIVHSISSLTHAHPRSQIACGIYTTIACLLIDNKPFAKAIGEGIRNAMAYYTNKFEYSEELQYFDRLCKNSFKDLPENDIKSSGYVVDTLEAALWCLLNTNSYKECILKAVNLGYDTDTTAAVAGGLAGIFYGYKSIPKVWIDKIARGNFIKAICNKFYTSLK